MPALKWGLFTKGDVMKKSLLLLAMSSLLVGNLFAEIGDSDSAEQTVTESKKSKELPFNISAQGELNQGNNQYDATYGLGLGLDKSTGLLNKYNGWDLVVTADMIVKGVDGHKEKLDGSQSRKGSAAIDTEAGILVQKDNLYLGAKIGMNAFTSEDTYANEASRYYAKLETGYRTKSGSSIGVGAIMNLNDHAKNNPNRIVDGVYIKTTYGF